MSQVNDDARLLEVATTALREISALYPGMHDTEVRWLHSLMDAVGIARTALTTLGEPPKGDA